MNQTTYDGNNYIISESREPLVYAVDDSSGRRRWLRVYDRELALAIREDSQNRQVQREIDEMDEAASQAHWAQAGYL